MRIGAGEARTTWPWFGNGRSLVFNTIPKKYEAAYYLNVSSEVSQYLRLQFYKILAEVAVATITDDSEVSTRFLE